MSQKWVLAQYLHEKRIHYLFQRRNSLEEYDFVLQTLLDDMDGEMVKACRHFDYTSFVVRVRGILLTLYHDCYGAEYYPEDLDSQNTAGVLMKELEAKLNEKGLPSGIS